MRPRCQRMRFNSEAHASRLDLRRRAAGGQRDERDSLRRIQISTSSSRGEMGTITMTALRDGELKVRSDGGFVCGCENERRVNGPSELSQPADSLRPRSCAPPAARCAPARAPTRHARVRPAQLGRRMGGAVTAAQCARHGPRGAAAQVTSRVALRVHAAHVAERKGRRQRQRRAGEPRRRAPFAGAAELSSFLHGPAPRAD